MKTSAIWNFIPQLILNFLKCFRNTYLEVSLVSLLGLSQSYLYWREWYSLGPRTDLFSGGHSGKYKCPMLAKIDTRHGLSTQERLIKEDWVVRTNLSPNQTNLLWGYLIVQVLERIFWAHLPHLGPLLNPLQSFHQNCVYQGLQFPSCCWIPRRNDISQYSFRLLDLSDDLIWHSLQHGSLSSPLRWVVSPLVATPVPHATDSSSSPNLWC